MIGFTVIIGIVIVTLVSNYLKYCSENKVGIYDPIEHNKKVLKQLNDMRLEIAKLKEEIKDVKDKQ